MKLMKNVLLAGLLLAGLNVNNQVWAIETENTLVEERSLIQMAILLDTSGSMSGLIEQAKTQLWSIVNEFAMAKRGGKVPVVQVALYEYGKSSIPSKENYLRMILPLTTDLDKVSAELFVLRTNGGDEYCGTVIKAATEGLKWSESSQDLKVIFIAGNEPFTQGKVDYRESCKAAISKGIIVNTIHCGSFDEGLKGKWEDGAKLADGKYLHIDQNRKAVQISAPQDDQIRRLGEELNTTYLAYGRAGAEGLALQAEQDINARSAAPAVMTQRAVAKSSSQYRNSRWDLVDAIKEKTVSLEEMKEEELPEEMRKMNEKERQEFIAGKQKEREKIQKTISELNDERKKFIAVEMKKRVDKGEDTLEAVIIKAVREQASKKKFKFETIKVKTDSEEQVKKETEKEKNSK
jgi:hypothetical protein